MNIKITRELIFRGATKPTGGWNKDQAECLGLSWPLADGWQRQAVGQVIPLQDAETFLRLKGTSNAFRVAWRRDGKPLSQLPPLDGLLPATMSVPVPQPKSVLDPESIFDPDREPAPQPKAPSYPRPAKVKPDEPEERKPPDRPALSKGHWIRVKDKFTRKDHEGVVLAEPVRCENGVWWAVLQLKGDSYPCVMPAASVEVVTAASRR